MSVGWEGCEGWGGREGDLPRLVPNREPRREEELGMDCWREGQSRLEVARRRMWGLLMMDPSILLSRDPALLRRPRLPASERSRKELLRALLLRPSPMA